METMEELIEVYRANQQMEADRAMVEVLEEAGIESFLRDRVSHAMPAPDSEAGNYFVAVATADADKARTLLAQALEDGALDAEEGAVIDAEE